MFRSCDEVSAALSEYLDGELTRIQAGSVEVHLALCAECAALAAALFTTVKAIRALATVRAKREAQSGLVRKPGAGPTWIA